MDKIRSIVTSEDGSTTVYQSDIEEHYHSIRGATQESQHIFIESALNEWINRQEKPISDIHLLEMGLGTGLNALLVALLGLGIPMHYYSFEAYPLEEEITSKLSYGSSDKASNILSLIHQCNWNKQEKITEHFYIYKIDQDFLSYNNKDFENLFDVVFFDAFSPDKQPAMWTKDIFSKLFTWMKKNSILSTYCAKGQVRRNMQEVGLFVERIPGPIGKREILRATKY